MPFRDAVAEDNTDKIKAAVEELNKENMQMGAAVYGQSAGAAAGPAGPEAGADGAAGAAGAAGSSGSSSSGSPGGDDNVIDAEFTDKK